MNNSAPPLRGRTRRSRRLASLLLLSTLALTGLRVALASHSSATGGRPEAPTVEVKRAKLDGGGPSLQELRYRLGDLRSLNLAEIGQELERIHKFLPGLKTPRVLIQAGPKITCRELGQVLDEILLRGFSSVEIQRLPF